MRGTWRRVVVCVCGLLGGVGASAAAQADGVEHATALARAGQFADAWRAAENTTEPVERSRARTAVFFAAGDLGGALRSASDGLEVDPNQLELLFYATSVTLTLGDHELATAYIDRFDQAVREDPDVPNRAVWQDWAVKFSRRAADQAARVDAKAAALTRARVTTGAAAAVALMLLLLARRA